MNHPERIFSFIELQTEDELVKAMINHTWPLYYSFFYSKLLYLSDRDSEDAPSTCF